MNIRNFIVIFLFTLPIACSADQAMDMRVIPAPAAAVAAPPKPLPDSIRIGIETAASTCMLEFSEGAIARDEHGRDYIVREAGVTVVADSAGLRWFFDTMTPGPVGRSWEFRPLGDSFLVMNGKSFRGSIALKLNVDSAALITIINEVGLEDYMRGVVAKEIGFIRAENFEAMKAQAVAARTYAVRNLGRRERWGFDLFSTHDDQVYGGVQAETAWTDSAVLETAGEVLYYDGQVVDAFYHSTCGGHTASMKDVWGPSKPYLMGVDDTLAETSACISSKVYYWTENYAGDTLQRLAAPYDTVMITAMEKDSSGRNQLIRIDRGDSSLLVIGDKIRTSIRRPVGGGLRSTLFDVISDTYGLRLNGRGWGHGIGMCQMGAIGRAKAGESYRDILSHYYPGTYLGKE